MGYSPPGSSVRGIAQARILGWVAMPTQGRRFPSPGDLPNPGDPNPETDSFPRAPSGKLMCCAVLCLVAQSGTTLCNPMDNSLPGSSVHGDLQARILEWVAMPSTNGSSQLRDSPQVSHIAGKFFTV